MKIWGVPHLESDSTTVATTNVFYMVHPVEKQDRLKTVSNKFLTQDLVMEQQHYLKPSAFERPERTLV